MLLLLLAIMRWCTMISNNIEDALLPPKVNESKGDVSRSSPEHQGEQKKTKNLAGFWKRDCIVTFSYKKGNSEARACKLEDQCPEKSPPLFFFKHEMFKIIAVNQLEESCLANTSILEIILQSKYWDKGKKENCFRHFYNLPTARRKSLYCAEVISGSGNSRSHCLRMPVIVWIG